MKYKILPFFLFFFTLGFSQEWKTNFKEAVIIAHEKNHKVIVVFQGSDWCAPCIKLDKQIWSTTSFKDYAKEHFVMLKADFPRRKKNKLSKEVQEQNNQLAAKYNPNGIFPFVVILNSDGKKIGETSYKKMSVEEYIQHLEAF
ncbi:thioredoxin family protein [Wenyingzhuangia sp. IMCC45574]